MRSIQKFCNEAVSPPYHSNSFSLIKHVQSMTLSLAYLPVIVLYWCPDEVVVKGKTGVTGCKTRVDRLNSKDGEEWFRAFI